MSITKIIKFYQFSPQPSFVNNGLTSIPMAEIMKTAFPTCKSYAIIYNKETYIIDIIEMNPEFLFGKCAKKKDFQLASFHQIRNKHTGESFPYTSVSPDTQLEVYTYFYVNYELERMSVIQHKNIGQIHHILSEGIWNLSKNTVKIFIAPERVKDIKKAAKNIIKSRHLNISFAPNARSKYNIDALANFLEIHYDSFSLGIKLTPSDNDNSDIDKIYDKYTKDSNSFTTFKLSGKNDFGKEETVDFIETLFTQSTDFDMTDDIAVNTELIKAELAKALYPQQ